MVRTSLNFSKVAIEEAHDRIRPHIHKTPVLTSSSINEITECQLFFKCENFQKVGAFKIRGATNVILQLSEEEKHNGVVTHSSGNHAQAVALAANKAETKAYIVMPTSAPKVKVAAVKGYGGLVELCEPTLEARQSTADKIVKETGAVFIHPYDNEKIIIGQATAAKELIDEINNLDSIVTPVGGGGLLGGTALSAKHFGGHISVYGSEPEGADDAYQSFKQGKLIPQTSPNTIVDGLLTSLGSYNFEIIRKNVKDILLVNDSQIKEAMQLIWERLKIIIEPSCAVPLAAILRNKSTFRDKRVGIILSGGNIDIEGFIQNI